MADLKTNPNPERKEVMPEVQVPSQVATPVVEAPTPVVTPPVVAEVPLVSKVSSFKKPEQSTTPATEEVKFDYSQLSSIKTPEEAKKWAEDAYKSFQRGENKKFQEIADMRKKLESQLSESSTWTPEKVQKLLNEPTFVNAAQTIMQNQTPQGATEEYLTDAEKAEKGRLQNLEQEINYLKSQNMTAVKAQQDVELKSKYANYEPQIVDGILQDLQTGRIQATREHLWRIHDYEPAIMRAYEMGKSEGKQITTEKIDSLSFQNGVNVKGQDTLPANGKLNSDFFKQLYSFNATKMKDNQLRK